MAVFFLIFQAVYAWATWPMDLIDAGMGALMETVRSGLPAGWWADLLVDGLLAGIGGVVIFVPQIALLFGAVAALEESGYMTRVAFLNDRWMRAVGLDGRATIPLLGGFACAIPAILSARTIPGKRERLLTILVTPWMTCSARLPVYLFLIGFVVPDQPWGPGGLFNLQGLFLFSIYAAGLLAGLALAWILHHGLPKAAPTQFIQEWPPYRLPSLKRTLGRVGRQAKAFVVGAGQVIVIVSVLLWGLSNTAPNGFAEVDAQHEAALSILEADQADAAAFEQAQRAWQAARMDASWSGKLGSWLEPVIALLGYDGRMGVALIASFAAREVFVGTMATLYAAPDDDEGIGALKQRLAREINPRTGQPILTAATAFSLIVFYMLAMQCVSTVAIVRKELGVVLGLDPGRRHDRHRLPRRLGGLRLAQWGLTHICSACSRRRATTWPPAATATGSPSGATWQTSMSSPTMQPISIRASMPSVASMRAKVPLSRAESSLSRIRSMLQSSEGLLAWGLPP